MSWLNRRELFPMAKRKDDTLQDTKVAVPELTPEEKYQQEREKYFLRMEQESLLDFSKTITQPEPVLQIADGLNQVDVCTLGNISMIKGKAKSRKSTFTSLLLAALVKNITVRDKITGCLPKEKRLILYFDTEQSPYWVQAHIKRAELTTQDLKNLMVFKLRPYETQIRAEFVERIITRYAGGIGAIFIDGVRDLIYSPNDDKEAVIMTGNLLRWSETHHCHIFSVLHENPARNGSDKARGHLGTELANKCETVFQAEKCDTDKAVSWIKPSETKGIEFEPFGITIDLDNSVQVVPYVGPEAKPRKSKPTQAEMLEATKYEAYKALKTAFEGKESLKRAELREVLMKALNIGENRADTLVTNCVEVYHILTKTAKGAHSFYTFTAIDFTAMEGGENDVPY